LKKEISLMKRAGVSKYARSAEEARRLQGGKIGTKYVLIVRNWAEREKHHNGEARQKGKTPHFCDRKSGYERYEEPYRQ